MRWIIPLYVIVSVLVGLNIYDWLDKEQDNPNLKVEQVNKLLTTYFTVTGADKACAKQMLANVVLEEYKKPDIEYVGKGLWVISNDLCSYTVSDTTGKVVGP